MCDVAEDVSPELAELLTGNCYCLTARRASRRMLRLYDAAIAGTGVTMSQLAAMAWIKGMRAPTVQKLSRNMDLEQSAMSRLLMPLERDGLVIRADHAQDKRKKVLALTAAGETALETGAKAWAKAQRQVEAEMEADLATLMSGINALAAGQGLR
ncbi:MarR family winged helix-turn-helix transcriptional regulator [Maritimibacter sp. DP1N21-5]|uniref:MarR family winged helix-turn-helix transcriptional regulator n=1 Tax=Maritimibacter sp. DP1N21-5 TaxID=2836867 RepID=UPI001C47A386|nr:MarR family transcriptional regulator [Maritimibacter sp. DP1N21-5]MBV7407640.1 MarR family transcriptional regulator [Maritimibacter sp. DP1N21-5]